MYLEISGRQSGKSTRLAKAVVEWCAEQPTGQEFVAYIVPVTWSEVVKKHLTGLIDTAAGIWCFQKRKIRCQLKINIVFSKDGYVDPAEADKKTIRRFFDEFDFNTNLDSQMTLWPSDYFCTTPSKIRHLTKAFLYKEANKDLLIRAWLQNNCDYVSNVNFDKPDYLKDSTFGENERFGRFYTLTNATLLVSPPPTPPTPRVIIQSLTGLNVPSQTILKSDIVVVEQEDGGFYIRKNRFGKAGITVPRVLLEKFLSNPAGELSVTYDWS